MTQEYQDEEKIFCQEFNQQLEDKLTEYKEIYSRSVPLIDAIIYGACSGNPKRLRPLLVYAVGKICKIKTDKLLPVAMAIETIHCYSLIHDDLPAMDDDDMRRGNPSCHKKFDEATAILAGDIMQVIAFEIIIKSQKYNQETKLQLVRKLVKACCDIVAGQEIDIRGETSQLSTPDINLMHQLKCGSLIELAMMSGTLYDGHLDKELMEKIHIAGEKIGLAFQIRDDILDEKQENKSEKYKSTYPNVLGMEESHKELVRLHQDAVHQVKSLPQNEFLLYLFRSMTQI